MTISKTNQAYVNLQISFKKLKTNQQILIRSSLSISGRKLNTERNLFLSLCIIEEGDKNIMFDLNLELLCEKVNAILNVILDDGSIVKIVLDCLTLSSFCREFNIVVLVLLEIPVSI